MTRSNPDYKIPAFLVLAFCGLNLIPYILQYHGGSQDEGLLLYGAQRIVQGDFPYRDFFSHHPPLSLWLLAGWFKIWGATIFAARWFMVLNAALIGLLLYLISRRLLDSPYNLLPPLLFACAGVSSWPVVSHHWNGVLFLLLSFWLYLLYLEKEKARLLYLVGLAAGLTFFVMQTEGLSISLALFLLIAFRSFNNLPKFLAGFFLPFLLLFPLLSYSEALPQYLYQNFLWAKDYGIPFNISPFSLAPIFKDWQNFSSQLGQVKVFNWEILLWIINSISFILVEIIKYGLFYPVLIMALGSFLCKQPKPSPFSAVLLLLIIWCAISFYRQDRLYLNYLTPLWYLLLVYGLHNCLKAKVGNTILLVLGFIFIIYNGFSRQDGKNFRYPIAFPQARLYSNEKIYAGDFNRLLEFLKEKTRPGDAIFAYPNAPAFYFLTQRKNPTSFNALWPLITPRQMIEKAKLEIEANQTPYIFMFLISPQALEAYPAIDKNKYYREDLFLQQTILPGYRKVEDFGLCRVWQRE